MHDLEKLFHMQRKSLKQMEANVETKANQRRKQAELAAEKESAHGGIAQLRVLRESQYRALARIACCMAVVKII